MVIVHVERARVRYPYNREEVSHKVTSFLLSSSPRLACRVYNFLQLRFPRASI